MPILQYHMYYIVYYGTITENCSKWNLESSSQPIHDNGSVGNVFAPINDAFFLQTILRRYYILLKPNLNAN